MFFDMRLCQTTLEAVEKYIQRQNLQKKNSCLFLKHIDLSLSHQHPFRSLFADQYYSLLALLLSITTAARARCIYRSTLSRLHSVCLGAGHCWLCRHPCFDFSSHCHEGLFDIATIFCRCLKKWYVVFVRESFRCLKIDLCRMI